MTELILDSLARRMRAMHSLYVEAVDTMTLEQVNHVEREGVLPIAFSLFHFINMEDVTFAFATSAPVVWDESWAERVDPAIRDHGKERTVEEMIEQRIGDLGAFRDYMTAVFERTERGLDEVDPASLTELIVARPFPPQVASTYSARVAGDEGITRLDAIECWVYQHGLRHMGEIEHARALVGLGGMTS